MKASNNQFPSILLNEDTEPSAPAAGMQRIYIDSTTHKLKRTDSSGVDVTIEGGVAGSGTLDAIPKFTPDGVTLGDSLISDDGSVVTVSGDLQIYNGITLFTSLLDTDNVGADCTFVFPTTATGGSFWIDTSGVESGLTAIDDPKLTWTSNSSFAAGFKCISPSANSAFFEFNLDSTTGLVTAQSEPSTGGISGWKFTRASGSSISPYFLVDGTFQAGDSTLTTVNKVTITAPATNATLTVANGKTLTASNTLTLAGTDATTHTFPATTSSVARIDAAQTFTGVQTFSSQDVHTLGIDLSTSGRLNSQVADAAAASSFTYQSNVALTSGTDRFWHTFKNQAGSVTLCNKADGTWEFNGSATTGGYINITGALPSTCNQGINFIPTNTGAGGSALGVSNVYTGGLFKAYDSTGGTAVFLAGGLFHAIGTITTVAYTGLWGGVFRGECNVAPSTAVAEAGGWKVQGNTLGAHSVGKPTTWYGGYVAASGGAGTSAYGLFLEAQTAAGTNNIGLHIGGTAAGYKSITLGGTGMWLGTESSTTFSLNATTVIFKADADHTAKNILTDTSTGTKIGTATTQKLGFWNVAPVIQPAAALQAALTNSTGGTQDGTLVDVTTAALADPAKINDNFTDVYALLDAIRTALVNTGIMKGAA